MPFLKIFQLPICCRNNLEMSLLHEKIQYYGENPWRLCIMESPGHQKQSMSLCLDKSRSPVQVPHQPSSTLQFWLRLWSLLVGDVGIALSLDVLLWQCLISPSYTLLAPSKAKSKWCSGTRLTRFLFSTNSKNKIEVANKFSDNQERICFLPKY